MKVFKFILLLIITFMTNAVYAQFTSFQGTVYNPQMPDNSILQRSLGNIERREAEAREQYNKLQAILGEYGLKLYHDEETLIWFDNYKKEISKAYYDLYTLGADEASNYALRKQGDIANDPELIARIRTAQEYNDKKRRVEERDDWDWEKKNEWFENNPYCFYPIRNDEGEIIGGRLGTKLEYEALKLEKERIRKEKEQHARLLRQQEEKRQYDFEHPFEKIDYSKYERIINYPECRKVSKGVWITKVALSPTETRIELKCSPYYGTIEWCTIDRDIFIISSGTGKLHLLNAENIPVYPEIYRFRNQYEMVSFALIFPPLPPNAKSFSLKEPQKKGWKIVDIKIEE